MRDIEYVVSISYYKFYFEDIASAAKFAETAIQHIEKEDKTITIYLNIIDDGGSDAEIEEA